MKKYVVLTFLLFTSFQILKAQEKDEFKLITSGRWYLEYVEMAGQKMVLPDEIQKSNWVIFHKDGKQEGLEQGKKYTGKWEYDKLKKIIRTNDLDGKNNQKLISVTENRLIFSVEEEGSEMIVGMKK